MQKALHAMGLALAVVAAVLACAWVITGMPAQAGAPAQDVTVTDTATVTESTTETDTATVTATESVTATHSVTATDTRTAHRTTTRVVPLPGSTVTRTLPGGTVVTTVVATPTSPSSDSTGFSAGAYVPGSDTAALTGQRSLVSLWPYLLAMLALVAAGVLTWALSNRSSRLSRHNHR